MNKVIKKSKIKIAGIETNYLHGGKGQPIVFVHGVPSSSFLWRHVMKHLANDFSVYAPDLPGIAESGNPKSFSLDSYVKWLDNFCNKIRGKEKINLVVHDIGGPIGLAWAIKKKSTVNQLIIMDTIVSTANLPLATKIVINPLTLWAFYNFTSKPIINFLMRSFSVNQGNKLSNKTLDEYYKIFLRDKRERNVNKIINGLKADINSMVGEKLSKISFPTLVLWAAKDLVIPFPVAEYIQSQIKEARIEILPNCGHFSQEEEPELIASHINKFLNKSLR